MTQILRQSTSIKVRIGPFVDKTDGVTPETGVTLGAADQFEILKANGAATVSMAGTFAAVSGADGWYDYTLSSGDTDTVGTLDICVQDASVCLPVFCRFQVVEETVFDALFAASATGIPTAVSIRTEIDSNSTQLAAILTDTGTTLDGKINTISTNVDAILVDTGTTLDAAIAVIDANVDAILVDTGTTLDGKINTISTNVDSILVDTGTTLDAAIAAVKVDTAAILVDTGTTLDAAIAAVKVDTAAILVDTGTTLDAAIAAIDANVDAILVDTTAILVDTGTTLDAAIAAVKVDTAAILVDTGTTLDAAIAAVKADTAAILVDTGTTLDAAIAVIDANVDAILVDTGTSGVVIAAAQTVASVTNEVTANVTKISGSATAADNLEASTLGIVATTVNDASATTTSFVITSGEATDDHFNGRVIVFTSGALANQATTITDYTGATRTVTVTALTEAPANGVSMVIV